MNDNDLDNDSYGFILHERFLNLKRLVLPINVNDNWLDRAYYKIRLQNNRISTGRNFNVCLSNYEIQLNFENVPPYKFLKTLKFVFSEVFFIIANNSSVSVGTQHIRLALTAESLKTPINLQSVELNDIGVKVLLSEIERTVQSNENILIDDTLKIFFCSCKPHI